MTGWQDIVTAPRDGTWVLVICAGTQPDTNSPYIPAVAQWHTPKAARWEDFGQLAGWREDCDGEPDEEWELTHWMPLPAPPASA